MPDPAGKAKGSEGKQQGGDPAEETTSPGRGRPAQQEQQQQDQEARKQHQGHPGPGIGRQHAAQTPRPGLEDEFRNGIDLIEGACPGEFEVVANIFIRGIQFISPLVADQSLCRLAVLEPGVAGIIIYVGRDDAVVDDLLPGLGRQVILAGVVGLDAGVPESLEFGIRHRPGGDGGGKKQGKHQRRHSPSGGGFFAFHTGCNR